MALFIHTQKTETIIIESDNDDVFKSIYTTIISNIQKSLGKVSGRIIDSVIDHIIGISKYNLLAGSSNIKLPKKLDDPRKGFIYIQNTDDNEWFQWCLVRYLNPVDHYPARIRKVDKDFAKQLDFKDIKSPVKVREIHKIEKKNSIIISVSGYEIKEKYPIFISKKCCEEKLVGLLLIGEKGRRHYVIIKNFNTFMYTHTLHGRRKPFCRYCLQALSTEEILKNHIKDCFKISGNQNIIMPKKVNMLNSKIMKEK